MDTQGLVYYNHLRTNTLKPLFLRMLSHILHLYFVNNDMNKKVAAIDNTIFTATFLKFIYNFY